MVNEPATVSDETTDEEIASRVQKGDIDAFGRLFDRYAGKMSRYATKFIGGEMDIEDAVQDVFIKAYANIQSFLVTKKFSTWLYRIAHNTFVNVIRKKRREKVDFFDFDTLVSFNITSDSSPETDMRTEEMRSKLEKTLGTLKPKYREILTLYYFEDKSYTDIADILQIPIATVAIRLKRAKEQIRLHFNTPLS